jgi:ethanolamine permease
MYRFTQETPPAPSETKSDHGVSLRALDLDDYQDDDSEEELPPEEESSRSDSSLQSEKRRKYTENSRFLQIANFWDVLAFGICLTSANLAYGAWHAGLILGFWSFFFATLMISTVFFALHLCIAEMISILPFSGGMYGFARVTVGPYLGFMVGCFEAMGNIIYTMYGMIQLGSYFCFITNVGRKYMPFFWLLFYVIIIMNEFLGRKYYFKLVRATAVLIIVILLFYVAISIPKQHPEKYFPESQDVNQTFFYGADVTIVSLQYAAFIYFAIEIIPLVSDEVKDAKKDTPRALIGTTVFVTLFGLLIMFLTFDQYPGYPWAIFFNKTPLNSGFTNTFPTVTERTATVFAYFPLLASVSIYTFGFAKQLKALGSSKLLPPFFAWTIQGTKIPYMSLLIGSALSYVLLMICYFRNETYALSGLPDGIYLTGFMCTYFAFIIVLISFIIFRLKYYNLTREFTSPLGIGGAIYAMCGFLLLLYTLIRYAVGKYLFAKIFFWFSGIITVYYFFYARHRQTFSEEEQKVLFVVYLMQCKLLFCVYLFLSKCYLSFFF